MTPTDFFTPGYRFTGTWDDYFVLLVMLFAVLLGVLLFRERPRHEPMVHSPRMAWIRGGLYFCFVIVFSWATGVFKAVFRSPLATAEQLRDPVWIAFAFICFAVFAWGYLYWWPRGTLTHGRKLYFVPALIFGLTWGACGGLFILSLLSILEVFQWPRLVTAIVLLIPVAVYNLNFQSGWWDIHVSPPHNIRAWNNKKVLFAHQPFLIVTFGYLFTYGNLGIYVLLNALAIGASAVAMHFPPFWEDDDGPVSLETAEGE